MNQDFTGKSHIEILAAIVKNISDREEQEIAHELLPPTLRYGVSFVLRRGETSTAPHIGRFPPGQPRFQPAQQHQGRVFIAATGGTTMRTLVLPVRE